MTNTISFDFTGAAVLVTGGTSGIGHATATSFADAGASVTVTGTRASPADYDTDLERFTYRRCQMTDPATVDAVVEALGQLDVLINNAGANFPGGRDEWEPEMFAAALTLNLAGPMRLTTACRQSAGRQHPRRRGERDQLGVALRLSLDPHRPRVRIGQGGDGGPHRQPGPPLGR